MSRGGETPTRRARPRARRLVRSASVAGGLVIVFALGIAAGWAVLPPLLDRLFPLPGATGLAGASAAPGVAATPTPLVVPTPSPSGAMLMNGIAISSQANCAGCHHAENGAMSPVTVPALAHPLAGWTQCTQCHANGRLVPVAAGHENITQDQCMACHQEQGKGSAPGRPHHVYPGQECTSCHNGTKAPLPNQMSARNACWLCHHETPGSSLFPSAAPEASAPPEDESPAP